MPCAEAADDPGRRLLPARVMGLSPPSPSFPKTCPPTRPHTPKSWVRPSLDTGRTVGRGVTAVEERGELQPPTVRAVGGRQWPEWQGQTDAVQTRWAIPIFDWPPTALRCISATTEPHHHLPQQQVPWHVRGRSFARACTRAAEWIMHLLLRAVVAALAPMLLWLSQSACNSACPMGHGPCLVAQCHTATEANLSCISSSNMHSRGQPPSYRNMSQGRPVR